MLPPCHCSQVYDPPAMGTGTIIVPGAMGGSTIGGISVDESRSIGVMTVNVLLGGLWPIKGAK